MARLSITTAVLVAVWSALVTSAWRAGADDESRASWAIEYLRNEQDRWQGKIVLYDDRESGAHAFFPGNWAGNTSALTMDPAFTGTLVAGTTAIKITYRPTALDWPRWASITWAYPDRNWGGQPGRDLPGATRLSGWIAGTGTIDVKIGGVNWPPDNNPALPNQDPFGREGQIALSNEWKPFVIDIPAGVSRKNVIGGFTIGFQSAATVYLDELAYDTDVDKNTLRLVRSYVPLVDEADDPIRNVAFVYDNAVLALAFLSHSGPSTPPDKKNADQKESENRAFALLDAFCWAQAHDRSYRDGRWRNGYAVGPLADPATNSARLPSIWDKTLDAVREDRYVVSSDVGNVAWACLALLSGCEILSQRHRSPEDDHRLQTYLATAARAAEWVHRDNFVDDDWGGYAGGFEGREVPTKKPDGPGKLAWRSVEHNLDYWVVCKKLNLLTHEQQWEDRAAHAKRFVLGMWNGDQGFFWAGRKNKGEEINQDAVPLDAQTWSVLAMGQDPDFRQTTGWKNGPDIPPCIKWVEKACKVNERGHSGFRFSDKGSNCWPEGAAQLAAVYRYLDRPERAQQILAEIVSSCPVESPSRASTFSVSGPDVGGGIKAAYPVDAGTGFIKDFGGRKPEQWFFKSRYHVGATSWFVLASQSDCNPFWLLKPNER